MSQSTGQVERFAYKRCCRCKQVKSLAQFSSNRSRQDRLDIQCRECNRERTREKKARHLAEEKCTDCGLPIGSSPSRWRCNNCRIRPTHGTWGSRNIRQQVFRAYAGDAPCCACCGQSAVEFLTLDHVNGGGRAHRRLTSNQGVYHRLRRNGFPPGFRILCFNCNMARGFYGRCPHERASSEPEEEVLVTGFLANTDRGVRSCTRCERLLPPDAFYANPGTRSGLQSRCRDCARESSRTRLRTARYEALVHYGGETPRCACCAEQEFMFLALDHISGEGPRMPGVPKVGNAFYAWLRREGFPPGLQVLCHSCNCAKGKNRQCPHQFTHESEVDIALA
jgi:hypothetical protein